MKKNVKSFTLMELIIVVVIIGILAAMAIPIYTNTVERVRGEACINNMRMICAAWRIYNMKNDPDYNPPDPPDNFVDINTINNALGITIDERNFGEVETGAGFYMDLNVANTLLHISANRLSGTYEGNTIACDYNYTTGVFTEGSFP